MNYFYNSVKYNMGIKCKLFQTILDLRNHAQVFDNKASALICCRTIGSQFAFTVPEVVQMLQLSQLPKLNGQGMHLHKLSVSLLQRIELFCKEEKKIFQNQHTLKREICFKHWYVTTCLIVTVNVCL